MKVVAIVQMRMGSKRLPGKVMKLLNGMPMAEFLLNRLSLAKTINEIIVATTNKKEDFVLFELAKKLGHKCYRGESDNVYKRYVDALKLTDANTIVRITGDCPLIDPKLVDKIVLEFFQLRVDYISNIFPPTYPDGQDIEVFSRSSFLGLKKKQLSNSDLEHVTPYFRNSGEYNIRNISNDIDYSEKRWTVDELCDLVVVQNVCKYFGPRIDFSCAEILKLQEQRPKLFEANQKKNRNEGGLMSSGQKLWNRAKDIIPGGNMLLSKRPEMFLPEGWPSYFNQSKGCFVWDLDGNKYKDFSIMGVGTNILGYGNEEVDDEVRRVLSMGNMSTLNCPEEVYLAEKLLEINPWADMVRFARTGGEANAIAIRIARAYSNKSNVAICGYHGWHDWYLSANLSEEKKLDGHLLPGLEATGVPRELQGTVFPFSYNKIEELRAHVKNNNIGVIKMEVMRNDGPQANFLAEVRKIASENNIVLIFDECTSGFRETFGGLHLKYGVTPDMAIYGKAMGNGYAVTAVVGKRMIMEAAQSSFISSTFWTERIGSAAGIKTLEVMENEKSWEQITNKGLAVKKRWGELATKFNINIQISGLPALASFNFESKKNLHYKTLITQEMLKGGFLASNAVYLSLAHTQDIIDEYFNILDRIFSLIADCENGRDVNALLNYPVCHGGFKRLN